MAGAHLPLVLFLVLTTLQNVWAGYGDPVADVNGEGPLPNDGERAIFVLFNFLRTDPEWWRTKVFPLYPDILKVDSDKDKLPVHWNQKLAGAMRRQTRQMAMYSPKNCTPGSSCENITDPTCRPPPLNEYCCFRSRDCVNPWIDMSERLFMFGYHWNTTTGPGGGIGEVQAGGTSYSVDNVFEVVRVLACDNENPPSQPEKCTTDKNSNNRLAIYGKYKVGGSGYAVNSSSELVHYWMVNTGYNDPEKEPEDKPNENPIAWGAAVFTAGYQPLGEFAFLMNWNDNSDNGGAPRDPSVLLSSGGNTNKLHMTRVDKGNTYYVSHAAPGPSDCFEYAFAGIDGKGQEWRFPEGGNLRYGQGCSGGSQNTFVIDSSAGSCECDGICFLDTCQALDPSVDSAATFLVSVMALIAAVLIVL